MNITKIVGVLSLMGTLLLAQPAANEQVLSGSGGDAVSMDKEWAVVGNKDNNIVYIYKFNYGSFEWENNSTITINNSTGNSQFGASVALHGDYLVIGQPLYGSNDRGRARVYKVDDTGSWNQITNKLGSAAGDHYGTAVSVHDNEDGTAEIAISAPAAVNANGSTGKVYTYSWDGTNVTAGTVLSGDDYARSYGASIDMKDDHLIVGAPDSEQPGQNDYVGAAYTYSFDGSAWVEYPSATYYRIKRNIANEKLGTRVAIENGNAIVSTAPSASAGSWRYEVGVNGSTPTWVEKTQFYPGVDAHGVDMENNITLSTSSTDTVRFYINDLNHSKYSSYSDMEVTTGTTTGALDSVQLYKDQAVVSDPGNARAVALDVPCGIRPTELKANEWALISVPCGDGNTSIGALFNGQLGGTYGDEGTWVMYENGPNYTGESADYVLSDVNSPMVLGKGYWIITDDDRLLEVQSTMPRTQLDTATGITAPAGGFYVRDLPDSVSGTVKKLIVGNPFPRAFKWQYLNIYIDGNWYPFGDANNDVYHHTGYVYDVDTPDIPTGQNYRAITAAGTPGFSDEIKPYQGVWIEDLGAYNKTGLKLGFPFMK